MHIHIYKTCEKYGVTYKICRCGAILSDHHIFLSDDGEGIDIFPALECSVRLSLDELKAVLHIARERREKERAAVLEEERAKARLVKERAKEYDESPFGGHIDYFDYAISTIVILALVAFVIIAIV